MKKLVLVLVMSLVTLQMTAQLNYNDWKRVDIVDEFGDVVPGESANIMFLKGTFTNSAVSKEKLTVKITDYGTALSVQLFEYNNRSAIVAYSEFGSVSVKTPAGKIVKCKTFAPKTGGLYFSDRDYGKFLEVFKPGCKVLISDDQFTNYGASSWVFTWE